MLLPEEAAAPTLALLEDSENVHPLACVTVSV